MKPSKETLAVHAGQIEALSGGTNNPIFTFFKNLTIL